MNKEREEPEYGYSVLSRSRGLGVGSACAPEMEGCFPGCVCLAVSLGKEAGGRRMGHQDRS